MTIVLTPANKEELKQGLTSKLGGYNFFRGEIRKGKYFVRVGYYYEGSNLKIQLTYWEDGRDCAIEYASVCLTVTGVVRKVSKFLNLK